MGESLCSQKNFEAFIKMYMDDRKAQEQDWQELRAQMEMLSLEMAAIRNETVGYRDPGNKTVDTDATRHKDQDNGDSAANFQQFSKLDFTRFNGLTDPLGWLSYCDHFLRHNNKAENAKVSITSYHHEGDAQLWFLKVERDEPVVSWAELKELCNQ